MDSKGTQPYINLYLFSPKPPSHPACHITLSRVPCTIQSVLLVIHVKYSSVDMSIPGEGNGNPLQYSCLENPTDREAWRATVHGVLKIWTQLND